MACLLNHEDTWAGRGGEVGRTYICDTSTLLRCGKVCISGFCLGKCLWPGISPEHDRGRQWEGCSLSHPLPSVAASPQLVTAWHAVSVMQPSGNNEQLAQQLLLLPFLKSPVNSPLYFCFSQRASCCLGITSQTNATFLGTSCAATGAVSRGPGSATGCRTASMTAMRRSAVSDRCRDLGRGTRVVCSVCRQVTKLRPVS